MTFTVHHILYNLVFSPLEKFCIFAYPNLTVYLPSSSLQNQESSLFLFTVVYCIRFLNSSIWGNSHWNHFFLYFTPHSYSLFFHFSNSFITLFLSMGFSYSLGNLSVKESNPSQVSSQNFMMELGPTFHSIFWSNHLFSPLLYKSPFKSFNHVDIYWLLFSIMRTLQDPYFDSKISF